MSFLRPGVNNQQKLTLRFTLSVPWITTAWSRAIFGSHERNTAVIYIIWMLLCLDDASRTQARDSHGDGFTSTLILELSGSESENPFIFPYWSVQMDKAL